MAQTLTAPITTDQLFELAERLETEPIQIRISADTPFGPRSGVVECIERIPKEFGRGTVEVEFTVHSDDLALHGYSEYVGTDQIQELEVLS